jgi:hypothetical protein
MVCDLEIKVNELTEVCKEYKEYRAGIDLKMEKLKEELELS